jgi:protein kinase A
MLNSECAFYAGCVVEALGHFHQRLIAYRDLKLENVLIDADGYCKVIDLGFAKLVTDKTYTLVGTPEYLCPEIIMSKGHDKAVDYWAFGVLLYELLVGHSPFYIPHSSQIDMFKRSEYNNTRFELFAPSGFPVILDRFAVILTISLSLVSQWL